MFSTWSSKWSVVGLNVLSSWLYDKLKGRADKLRINRTEVEIEPDKIRVVVEQIEKDSQSASAAPLI
jgi:hypothetical protein